MVSGPAFGLPSLDANEVLSLQRGQSAAEPVDGPIDVNFGGWLEAQVIDNRLVNICLEPNAAMFAMLPDYPAIRGDLMVESQPDIIADANPIIGAFDHAPAHRKIIK